MQPKLSLCTTLKEYLIIWRRVRISFLCPPLIYLIKLILLLGCITLQGCERHESEEPLNDPYPYESEIENTRFASFSERPKHLDPARSYTESEWAFIGQIYEPPLQYNYLKRPYVLEPSTALTLPEVYYYNEKGEQISEDSPLDTVANTEYWITLKQGVLYQPHPAFAKDEQGNYRYLNMSDSETKKYKVLSDFEYTGSREMISDDFVYQIKRLAEPSLSSPIFGLMSRYIEGLTELRETLQALPSIPVERDLRPFTLSGATVIDRYTYKIRIKGKYPQFRYWLAMMFFSPLPWEAAQFFAQKNFNEHNLTLDWYPVGTGAYMLTENNPDRRMALKKNPNFRDQFYPTDGTQEDVAEGLLMNAGKRLPMIDNVIFSLEREDIPFWNKFLQGYYDISGISSDNFNSAVRFSIQGNPDVSPILKERGIRLQTAVSTGVWYWGFNMLDETLGGTSERAKNLRKAIGACLDIGEFLTIFLNDRGIPAKGPIPPEIFGYDAQTYQKWTLEEAQNWIKKEGLLGMKIYYDVVSTGEPDEIATQAWLMAQFEKIGLQLILRASDFNRFQDKVRHGTAQMFFWGWSADYPDPENFLFLFYGPNGAAKYGGENTSNYSNNQFDALYEQMRVLPDGPDRFAVIQQMTNIINEDMPWIYGFYPKSFALYHAWTSPSKITGMAINNLKYVSVDPKLRFEKQKAWNVPLVWPLWFIVAVLILIAWPAVFLYFRFLYGGRGRVSK